MNTLAQKNVKRKLSLLELATELGNISQACRKMKYSRQQFYEIRREYQTFGAVGLADKLPGCKTGHPNRVSEEVEKSILDYSLEFPTHGPLRVSQNLSLRGINVSTGGIRGVWGRHKLLSRTERLLRLDNAQRDNAIALSDEQAKLLERFSPEFRDRHIEVSFTGELVAVDTFFVGTLKGIGKVYLQTVLDCFSRYAWGQLHTTKLPVTAVSVMNNVVLPFFEDHDTRIRTVLSDNGREYCGRPDGHLYEIFLDLEGIEHRTTKVRRPQSNGFIERLHRTLLDEHFRIKGRTKFYESIAEMQQDLDEFLIQYNMFRPHQGRNMLGRVPYEVFKSGLRPDENMTKEVTPAA